MVRIQYTVFWFRAIKDIIRKHNSETETVYGYSGNCYKFDMRDRMLIIVRANEEMGNNAEEKGYEQNLGIAPKETICPVYLAKR